MDHATLHSLLESRYQFYNNPVFIPADPVSVPHLFIHREDIEIAGFLTATISWGNRRTILASATRLMALMGNSPSVFLMNATPNDLRSLLSFVHRTFNGDDCLFFISALQRIYREYGGLEPLFSSMDQQGAAYAISHFRKVFLSTHHLTRSEKHLADPMAGSAAKRINMFLRWMVRRDDRGVDFGLWRSIDPKSLVCPLDVHSGRVARRLGLLERKQNDWKAATELTERLRNFDPDDPVRFDFALFGMGVGPYPPGPLPQKREGGDRVQLKQAVHSLGPTAPVQFCRVPDRCDK